MIYKSLKPAANLQSTLMLLTKQTAPAVVRLKRGLRIAHAPNKHLTAYRPGVMPSADEVTEVVKAARQAGLDVSVDQAEPAAWGAFAAWLWKLRPERAEGLAKPEAPEPEPAPAAVGDG